MGLAKPIFAFINCPRGLGYKRSEPYSVEKGNIVCSYSFKKVYTKCILVLTRSFVKENFQILEFPYFSHALTYSKYLVCISIFSNILYINWN